MLPKPHYSVSHDDGCFDIIQVTVLPALEDYPDSCFCEDPALCLPGGNYDIVACSPDISKILDVSTRFVDRGRNDYFKCTYSILTGLSRRSCDPDPSWR